ncbi:hypothetical protein HUT18_15670 [Streptomyces sp. NA04227]|uniref:hypothetical protein n=1 Tax=Streptomyces sp. NA04227 TaxID=2742136 RepID=UPI001592902E|nr:hypothetical protein [Streptomyces sp. NA04227]QKW07601.1 hypothetical protein HUT18_15670 [Streptomyces sp. NA04227]
MRRKVVGYGLALAVVTLGAVVNWPEGGKSPADGPDRKRFEERAAEIARDWPEVRRSREVDSGLTDVGTMREFGEPPRSPVPTEGYGRVRESTPWPAWARSVTVTLTTGACVKDLGTHVHETERLVVVGGWWVSKSGACTSNALTRPVEVRLRAELGDRQVVDAVTGEALRPSGKAADPLLPGS